MSLHSTTPQRALQGRGFTLVELLVTLAVAAIFLAIAFPSYRAMINRNSVATQVNDFLTDLNYARSEAITRGVVVRMCASSDGASCAGSGGWQQGWLVYSDPEDDQAPQAGDALRVRDSNDGQTSMRGNANVAAEIRFSANGFALGNFGTIAVCSQDSEEHTNIVIASTGRASSRKPATSDTCSP